MTDSAAPASHPQQPYIRLATLEDLDKIVDIAGCAFIHDPVINYFGNVKKVRARHVFIPDIDLKECQSRRTFLRLLTKACFLVGGRITVIVDPAKRDSNGDKIVAGALWLPPKKRLAVWMVPTILKAGVVSVLKRWGLTGLLRVVVDYQGTAESKMHLCFKNNGVKKSPEDSWYLQLVFTDPDYQGRGFMSLLVREAFAHAPEDTYVLEATTAKSRDQYLHLGFESPTAINFGKGKADGRGVATSGADAVGVEIWAMAKVR
ncbi:hypothetical protein BDZ97DRAFT_1652308 [Flammula alnicola]|nr:hypothetical protein BDZ97DRAFT_1652308 [Flammula alnicola]